MKVEIKLPRETDGVMVAEEVKKRKVGVNRQGGEHVLNLLYTPEEN